MAKSIGHHVVIDSNRRDQQKEELAAYIVTACRKDACAECGGSLSVVAGGNIKGLVAFPNGVGGRAFYLLCALCATDYGKRGKAAIPNVWADSCLAVLTSLSMPKGKTPVWIH